MIILKFIVFMLAGPSSPLNGVQGDLHEAGVALLEAAKAAIELFKVLHSNGYWLPSNSSGRTAYLLCRRCVKGYAMTAARCFEKNVNLFGITPKYHGMHHMYMDFKKQLPNPYVENPLAYSCEPAS